MKKYDYTTLFDQRHPALDEDELEERYDHPLHPIYANQIGVIRPSSPELHVDQFTNGYMAIGSENQRLVSIGPKNKILYECYTGQKFQTGFVYHVNCNFQDFTPDNLALSKSNSGAGYKTYRKLLDIVENRTVNYMLIRSEELEKNGKDSVKYWELAQVPDKLFKKWKVLFERRYTINLQE